MKTLFGSAVEVMVQQNLTYWYYKYKIKITTIPTALPNSIVLFDKQAESEKLHELSLVGDIVELEKEIAILAKSDVKLTPLNRILIVTEIQKNFDVNSKGG